MVKKIIFAIGVFTFNFAISQSEFQDYKGILRFQGTLSFGYNTAFKSTNVFLHGDAEYFLDNKISARSDVFYFLNSNTKNAYVEPFAFQHSLFSGVQYHFGKSHFDPYFGFQPGLVYGQRKYVLFNSENPAFTSLPAVQKSLGVAFALNTGVNYFANRFFHFFVHLRYQYGWFSDNYTTALLSEIRISFGLGIFIRTIKN